MIDQLRIAFVTGGLSFGGSTTFPLYLASGLRSLGVTSEIYSFTKENAFARDFASAGIPVHVSDEGTFIFEDRLAALYKNIANFKPDVVIANIGTEAFELLRYIPRGVTRIGMIHDPINQAWPPMYRDCLEGVIAVNPAWVEVTRHINPGLPCTYLAHGIPLPESGILRTPSTEGPLSLTYFGRLTKVKGARLFPEITNELHRLGVPFCWAIYGSGPEEDYVRQSMSAEIQRGEILLSPQVPRNELFSTIRKHDLFIMASEVEGGPLTLLEAMSVGLVPICNDTPCLAQEVVTAENGFIIPREPAKYAGVISILHNDRSRLERMSAAARKSITERYSTKAMAERYLEFIAEIRPNPISASWPARIIPRAHRYSGAFGRFSQNNPLARQMRRIVKRIRA